MSSANNGGHLRVGEYNWIFKQAFAFTIDMLELAVVIVLMFSYIYPGRINSTSGMGSIGTWKAAMYEQICK